MSDGRRAATDAEPVPAPPAAARPGAWIRRPALALAVVCVLMALQAWARASFVDTPRPGIAWTGCAFFAMGVLFVGQARAVRGQRWGNVMTAVGATAATFFAWLWLSEAMAVESGG